jgi:hypothetical protein
LDSFFTNVPNNVSQSWFIQQSFELIEEADIICFAEDWEQYAGCIIEQKYSNALGKECIYLKKLDVG